MSLQTPPKLRKLQRKLYKKAKEEPEFRFYALYDKIYRDDILMHAWELVRHNGGTAGVDGVSIDKVEQKGVADWLEQLQEELRDKEYEASPVRRVWIPKSGGGQRPLGIPTVEDRVVQMATKLVIEPIFEQDFEDNAYGYRPERSALDAVKEVHKALKRGRVDVVDADLSSYFDTIPHGEVMKSVAKRVSDGRVLGLIKMWLDAPIIEEDDDGTRRTQPAEAKGTPQGGVISPLLANLYMNRFLKFWREQKLDERLDARLVNYADDFVILTRGHAREAHQVTEWFMGRVGLTLNTEKTHIVDANEETFEFLGYEFGWEFHRKMGHRYRAAQPSATSVSRLKQGVKRWLERAKAYPWEAIVRKLNQKLEGWATYFSYGTQYLAYRAIDHYVYDLVARLLANRHGTTTSRTKKWTHEKVFEQMGVTRMRDLQLNSS